MCVRWGSAPEGRRASRHDAVRALERSETPALMAQRSFGRPHALTDYRGSIVLVNFWATWCEPCRAEMASMRRLQERLAGKRSRCSS